MERLTLKRNGAEVDVWSASLPSMDERRQSVARGQLRAILAGYLDASAAEIVFQIGRHGKPVLAGPHGAAGLHFNLSHSRDQVLYAITRNGPVGVDLQHRQPRLPWRGLARRFFSPAELRRLRRLSGRAGEREFYRLWARKEAMAKAAGRPILSSLGRTEEMPGWRLWSWQPEGQDAAACVALYCDQ